MVHMEELREVALAYYDNCSPELRGKAREFFQSMDTNRDQRICLKEFKEFLHQTGYNTIITDPDFFAKLDRNGDRGLDFQEVLTFYYIIKTGYIACRGCRIYLSGFYFTCFKCFEEANSLTYDLCDACHRSRNFTHPHTFFLENRILLYYKRGPDNNMAMGDLYASAIAYYYNINATPEFRGQAQSFFQSVATIGAHQIRYTVFNEYLQQTGYNWIINDPTLFEKLDRNRDGSLDFWELLTFYYVISTRYYHCRQCGVYLSGLYFTCVACFDRRDHHPHHYDPGTYNLCRACYGIRNFSHHHSYFLDNHILLRSIRDHRPYEPHLVSAPQPISTLVVNNNYYINHYHLPAVQPVPPRNNWLSPLKLLELAISAGNLAANCSIM